MKRYIVLLLFVVAVISLILLTENSLTMEDLQWHSFKWQKVDVGDRVIEKGAVYLPIKIAGVEDDCWLQFDTGSHSQFYEVSLQELNFQYQVIDKDHGEYTNDENRYIEFDGEIAGLKIDRPFRVKEDYGASIKNFRGQPVKVGTLGMDFFEDRVLLLDYSCNRFSVADGIPGEIVQKARFVQTEVKRREIFIDMLLKSIIKDREVWLEFDTGTGIGTALLKKDIWQEVTGKKLDDPQNMMIKASSWGNRIAVTGARVDGSLKIGSLNIEKPLVYTIADADFPQTLGNKIFLNNYLVIIDLKSDRFGYLKR